MKILIKSRKLYCLFEHAIIVRQLLLQLKLDLKQIFIFVLLLSLQLQLRKP